MSVDPYLGEIRLVSFHFAPRGWARCDGQLLPISQNQHLFSLIGTMYGGDGRTNFALPDFRGRMVIGRGEDAPGRSDRAVGETGGVESVTLTRQQLPAHQHRARASSAAGSSSSPSGGVPAVGGAYANVPDRTLMDASAVGFRGATQPAPHSNVQPELTLTYVIALQGIYPSAN